MFIWTVSITQCFSTKGLWLVPKKSSSWLDCVQQSIRFFPLSFPSSLFYCYYGWQYHSFFNEFWQPLKLVGLLVCNYSNFNCYHKMFLRGLHVEIICGRFSKVVSFVRGPRYQKVCEPLLCLNANILYTGMTDCQ